MIDFYNGSLLDIIPENFKTYETEALSFSVQQALQKLQDYAKATAVYSAVEELPDPVLNLLATELRAQYYNTQLPRKTREGIVKSTFAWYLRGGTGSVLEEYLGTLYQGGKITEWFQYGGEPFYFKAVVDLKPDEEIEVGDGIKIIQKINEYKNVRSWLEALLLHVGTSFCVPVRYENTVHIQTSFHPRYNLPFLLLDRTWKLDGSCRMSGYASDNELDFYPAGLRMQAGVEGEIRLEERVRLAWESQAVIKTESALGVRNEAEEAAQTDEGIDIRSAVRMESAPGFRIHTVQEAKRKFLTEDTLHVRAEAAETMCTTERVRIGSTADTEVSTETRLHIIQKVEKMFLNGCGVYIQTVAGKEFLAGEQVQIGSAAGLKAVTEAGIYIVQKILHGLQTGNAVQMQTTAGKIFQTKGQVQVQAEAAYNFKIASFMTKMNQTDGTWKLDGSRKLDGGHYTL